MMMVLEAASGMSVDEPPRAALQISDPTPEGVPDVVKRMARGGVSILISGETGVGKEVMARTLHEISERTGQFVAINCASLSETLLESELFGHERGAFTGANRAKPGLFEVAAGGTVFLDEIGELPPGLQAKLLRVLETRSVYRVGGVKPVSLDVRFVAATHRDLAAEVERGNFRRDLYFRVNGMVLTVIPLRARKDIIPELAGKFLAQLAQGRRPPRLGTSALALLMQHDWPGNVRELRTVMERASVVCHGDEIRSSHILLDQSATEPPPRTAVASGVVEVPEAEPMGNTEERQRIIDALQACAGNQTRAARRLGISRTTLVHKLAVYRIPRPRPRSD
jgi:transcriptional regulator with PAS, ATPase and Fis domain